MKRAHKFILATAIAASLSLDGVGALRAAEASSVLTMKPLQGVSFDVAAKHSVSYFLSDSGRCKLVMTLADEPDWSDVPSFTAIRFEAVVPAGRRTRYNSGEGKAVEFACLAEAQTMSVRVVEEFAAESPR